jgi:DNA-binding transcriptional ArsR family regulator
MLKVHFGVPDWGRIRLADHPVQVLEIVLMLSELRNRRHGNGNDWRTLVRSAFPASAQPLLLLVPACDNKHYPDALHPTLNTPPVMHAEAPCRMRKPGSETATMWLRQRVEADPAALRTLDRAMRDFQMTCLAPLWSSVLTMFDNDIAERAEIISRHGLTRMLNTLSPSLRLNGDVLEIPSAREEQVDLNNNGLILMPSAFWTGQPLITGDPQRVLVYPASHELANEFDTTKDNRTCDALSAVLGPTRARVLRALREPHTTSSLAKSTRISRSSASEHATALREAGMITSRRQGRGMHHSLTAVGRSLLEANAPRLSG